MQIDSAVESNESIDQVWCLDDSGVIRWIDVAETIRRISRDGVAAINASVRIGISGHAARLTCDLIAIVISMHRTWSEAHGRFLSLARSLKQVCRRSLRHAQPYDSYIIIRTLSCFVPFFLLAVSIRFPSQRS